MEPASFAGAENNKLEVPQPVEREVSYQRTEEDQLKEDAALDLINSALKNSPAGGSNANSIMQNPGALLANAAMSPTQAAAPTSGGASSSTSPANKTASEAGAQQGGAAAESSEMTAEERKKAKKDFYKKIVDKALQHFDQDQIMVAGDILRANIPPQDLVKLEKSDQYVRVMLRTYYDVHTVRSILDQLDQSRVAKEEGVRQPKWEQMCQKHLSAIEKNGDIEKRDGKNAPGVPGVTNSYPGQGDAEKGANGISDPSAKSSTREADFFFGKAVQDPSKIKTNLAKSLRHVFDRPAMHSCPGLQPAAWELLDEADGIKTSMRTTEIFKKNADPSSRIYTFIVEGEVQMDFLPLLSLLNEVDQWTNWSQGCNGIYLQKAEVLERLSRCHFVVRLLWKMPYPYAYRQAVIRIQGMDCLTKSDKTKQICIMIHGLSRIEEAEIIAKNPNICNGDEQEYAGSERIVVEPSSIIITPRGRGSTYVQVLGNFQPRLAGSMPDWLVNTIFCKMFPLFLHQLRQANTIVEKSVVYGDRIADPFNPFYSWLKDRIRQSIPWEVYVPMPDIGVCAQDSLETITRVRALLENAIFAAKRGDFRGNYAMTTEEGKSTLKRGTLWNNFNYGGRKQKEQGGWFSGWGASKTIKEEDEDESLEKKKKDNKSKQNKTKRRIDPKTGRKEAAAGFSSESESDDDLDDEETAGLLAKAQGVAEDGDDDNLPGNVPILPVQNIPSGTELILPANHKDYVNFKRDDPSLFVRCKRGILNIEWAQHYWKYERRVTVLNVKKGLKVRPGLHWAVKVRDCLEQPYGTVVGFDVASASVKVKWTRDNWFSIDTKIVDDYRMGPIIFDLAIFEDDADTKGESGDAQVQQPK